MQKVGRVEVTAYGNYLKSGAAEAPPQHHHPHTKIHYMDQPHAEYPQVTKPLMYV